MSQRGDGSVVVIGSINADLVVRTPRMPQDGETLTGESFHRYSGGKGANQAVAAARLGAAVRMVGCVGDDELGSEQVRALASSGVDVSLVRKESEVSTGVACILVDGAGRNRIVVVPGANGRVRPADVDAARAAIASSDILLVQLEIPLETVARAVAVAREVGTRVVLNPAPARELPADVLAGVHVLTPNETEAEALTGMKVDGEASARRAAEALLESGVGAVVITLGERGALVAARPAGGGAPAFERVPAYRVEAVDTVAAGDAFSGALAFRLAKGETLSRACAFAAAVAAISVTRHGAQPSMPSLAEVEAFIRSAKPA